MHIPIELNVTPQIGFEPMANRLTADCSTTELLRNDFNHA